MDGPSSSYSTQKTRKLQISTIFTSNKALF
jgi:hypothetical protein